MMRLSLIAGIAMILAACSYEYEIKAIEKNGKVFFEPIKGRGNGCISNLKVVDETGETVWELNAGQYRYGQGPCENDFPLEYGAIKPSLPTVVSAKPLEEGVLYRVVAWDGDSYTGAFRLQKKIVAENLKLAPGEFADVF